MAFLVKRGNTWYVRFKKNGRMQWVSCQTSMKKLAEKVRLKYAHMETEQAFDLAKKKPLTLGEFYEKYMAYAESTHSKQWLHNKKLIFENFLFPYFDKKTLLKHIRQSDIEAYRSKRLSETAHWSKNSETPKKVGKRTVNIETNCLLALLRQAEAWGELEARQLPRIKKLEESQGRIRFLSLEEILALRTALQNHSREMTAYGLLMLYGGLRSGEALALRWLDVDLDRQALHIAPREGWTPKSKKGRIVPLLSTLYEFLVERRREIPNAEWVCYGDRYSPGMLKRGFIGVVRAAGLPVAGESKVSAHILRHTCASHLVMGGMSLYAVAAFLGHSDVSTTKIYSHLAPGFLRSQVKEISF